MNLIITKENVEQFRSYLIYTEKSRQTIRKYLRDIRKFQQYAGNGKLTKELLVQYKGYLEQNCHYKVSSINSYLAAVNQFCCQMGWSDLRVNDQSAAGRLCPGKPGNDSGRVCAAGTDLHEAWKGKAGLSDPDLREHGYPHQ